MIEDEIFAEIKEQKAEKIEEPCLFPKKEWDGLVKWHPVALDPYENVPQEIKDYHHSYCKLWNLYTKNKGR
jgi:hypothetical protein